MAAHCAHCRSCSLIERNAAFECGECGGFTTRTGEPFRPEVCERCQGDIVWNGDRYSCVGGVRGHVRRSGCGRSDWGPFPVELGTTKTDPAAARRSRSGVSPGRPVNAPV